MRNKFNKYKKSMGPSVQIKQRKELLTRQDVKKIVEKETRKQMERKWVEYSFSGTVDNASTVGCVSIIPVGTSNTQRIGDSVEATSMQIYYDVNVADSYNLVRMVVFQWRSDSTPVYTDILDRHGNTAIRPLDFYNQDNKQLYTIIYDKIIQVDDYNPNKLYKKNVDLTKVLSRKNMTIDFDTTDIGGTNPLTGFWVLFVSDSGAITHPGAKASIRVYYRDA